MSSEGETTAAGSWVAEQTRKRERTIWAGVAVFGVVSSLMLFLAVDGRLGIALSLVFLLGVLLVRPYANRYMEDHLRWLRGATAEKAVGDLLNELRAEGWTIVHDIKPPRAANIDHLACGPGGAFLIETKARRYEDAHLSRVKRQAAQTHDELGVWVTPVICLYRRDGGPFRSRGVWVLPSQHLLSWLRSQHQAPVSEARLARFIESLTSSVRAD